MQIGIQRQEAKPASPRCSMLNTAQRENSSSRHRRDCFAFKPMGPDVRRGDGREAEHRSARGNSPIPMPIGIRTLLDAEHSSAREFVIPPQAGLLRLQAHGPRRASGRRKGRLSIAQRGNSPILMPIDPPRCSMLSTAQREISSSRRRRDCFAFKPMGPDVRRGDGRGG